MAKRNLRKKLLRRTLKRRSLKRSRRTMKRRNTLKRSRKSMKRRNTLKRSRRTMKSRKTFGGSIEELVSLPHSIEIIAAENTGKNVVKYQMIAIKEKSDTEMVPLHSKRYREFVAFKEALNSKVESLNTELKINKNQILIDKLDKIKEINRVFPTVGTGFFSTHTDEVIEKRRVILNIWIIAILGYIREEIPRTYEIIPHKGSAPVKISSGYKGGDEIVEEFLRFLNADTYP